MHRIENKHKAESLRRNFVLSQHGSPVKGRHGVRSPMSDNESIRDDPTLNRKRSTLEPGSTL